MLNIKENSMDFFSFLNFLWSTFHPIQVLMYLLLVGLIVNLFSKNKLFKVVNLITLILFILIVFLPNGTYLLWKLENTYSKPKIFPDKIDGMLILGSGTDPLLTDQHGQVTLTESIERITESIELIKKFPDAKVVYSGGMPTAKSQEKLSGVDVAKMFFTRMKIDVNKIIFEDQSKDTYENFIFSKKFINNTDGEKWLLVTSASHMKRAMSVAEKLGLNFIPYPVDYIVHKNYSWKVNYFLKGRRFLKNLNHFKIAAHEYVGLIAYYLSKRSSKLI